MPTIKDAKDDQELLQALIEVATEANGILHALDTKKGKPALSNDANKKYAALSKDVANAPACIKLKLSDRKLDPSIHFDLVAQCSATLMQIALAVSDKLDKPIDDERMAYLPDQANMPEWIRAYRRDTGNHAWGGDAEAHHAASLLRICCKVFTVSNKNLQYVTTVGQQHLDLTRVHLLHRGNHYDMLKVDAQQGEMFADAKVQKIDADGDCLYNALREIAKQSGQGNRTVEELRTTVSQWLTDEEIEVALIAIVANQEFVGLGGYLRAAFGLRMPMRQDALEGLSLLFLALAKDQVENAQEVQAIEIDGGLMISSNSDAEYQALVGSVQKMNDPAAAAAQLEALLKESQPRLLKMQECYDGDRAKLVRRSLRTLGSKPVIAAASGDKVTQWFSEDDKSKRQERREVYLVKNTAGVHAEQFLLLLLARRLRAGLVPEQDIIVRGVKPPCSTCLSVIKAFAKAYEKAYGKSLFYNEDEGRNEEKPVVDISELDKQDQNQNKNDKCWPTFLATLKDAFPKQKKK